MSIKIRLQDNSPEEIVRDKGGDVVLCVPKYSSNAVQHLSTHPTANPTTPWRGGWGGVVWPGQGWGQTVMVVAVGCGWMGEWGGEGMVEPGEQNRHSFHVAASHTQLIQEGNGSIQIGASWWDWEHKLDAQMMTTLASA